MIPPPPIPPPRLWLRRRLCQRLQCRSPPPALPIPIPTLPVVPTSGPAAGSPLGQLAALASSPAVQSVLEVGAEVGVTALVASNPELAPVSSPWGRGASQLDPATGRRPGDRGSWHVAFRPATACRRSGRAGNGGQCRHVAAGVTPWLPPPDSWRCSRVRAARHGAPRRPVCAAANGNRSASGHGARDTGQQCPERCGSSASPCGASPSWPVTAGFCPGLANAIGASRPRLLASGPLPSSYRYFSRPPAGRAVVPGGLPATGCPLLRRRRLRHHRLPRHRLRKHLFRRFPWFLVRRPRRRPAGGTATLAQSNVQPTIPGALPPNLPPLYQRDS